MMTQGNRPLTLEEATAKLEELIADRPELSRFQFEIDCKLSHCRNLEEKMHLLFGMITTNLTEMQAFFKDIEDLMGKDNGEG